MTNLHDTPLIAIKRSSFFS